MDISDLSPLLPGPLRPSDATGTDASLQTASADFETFLTLLTAQLRNQDPLSPLDSTEFIAQLASFSSVEQQVLTNERLSTLATQSFGGDIGSFANWIGKDVSVKNGTFQATGSEVRFRVPALPGADATEARILDASGTERARFAVSPDSNGIAIWDGLDAANNPVRSGTLSIELTYFEDGSISDKAIGEVARRVSGLRGTPNGILLDLDDGGAVAPEEVVRVSATRQNAPVVT